MEHAVAIKDVPVGSVVLIANRLWVVESKGPASARLCTANPPPRGWTTDYTTAPLDGFCAVLTEDEVTAWRPSPSRLVVEVTLGNEAMQSRGDLERALHLAFTRWGDYDSMRAPMEVGDGDKVVDRNGNTVGKWEVL